MTGSRPPAARLAAALAAPLLVMALMAAATPGLAQTPASPPATTPAPAANPGPKPPRAPGEAPEGGAWMSCKVAEIAAWRDHYEFVCDVGKDTAGAPPSTYSLERRDGSGDAYFTLAVEAKRSARPLMILYVKSPQANPDDCPVETCRRLVAVRLK